MTGFEPATSSSRTKRSSQAELHSENLKPAPGVEPGTVMNRFPTSVARPGGPRYGPYGNRTRNSRWQNGQGTRIRTEMAGFRRRNLSIKIMPWSPLFRGLRSWLPDLGSNQSRLVQSEVCYQLHHPVKTVGAPYPLDDQRIDLLSVIPTSAGCKL